MIAFYITTIICVIIIILYLYVTKEKHDTISDIYTRLYNEKSQTRGFTYNYKDGLYENYRLTDDNKLLQTYDPLPMNTDGELVSDVERGIVSYVDDGFYISGVENKFTCPAFWKWDNINHKCVVESICKEGDENVIRGINYYQFNQIRNNVKYHDKVYAVCANESVYTLKSCENNTNYIGGALAQINDNVCETYDPCQDFQSKTKHILPKFEGDILTNKEYYICNNGVSEKQTCSNDFQYSSLAYSCVKENKCSNVDDGVTLPLSDYSYIKCVNGLENIINCYYGVNTEDTILTCKKVECEDGPIYNSSTEFYSYVSGQLACVNGSLTTINCNTEFEIYKLLGIETQYNQNDKIVNIKPKTVYDKDFKSCVPATDSNLIKIKDVEFEVQLHKSLPKFKIDVNKKIIPSSVKQSLYYEDLLYTPDGSTYDAATNVPINDTFYTSDRLKRYGDQKYPIAYIRNDLILIYLNYKAFTDIATRTGIYFHYTKKTIQFILKEGKTIPESWLEFITPGQASDEYIYYDLKSSTTIHDLEIPFLKSRFDKPTDIIPYGKYSIYKPDDTLETDINNISNESMIRISSILGQFEFKLFDVVEESVIRNNYVSMNAGMLCTSLFPIIYEYDAEAHSYTTHNPDGFVRYEPYFKYLFNNMKDELYTGDKEILSNWSKYYFDS